MRDSRAFCRLVVSVLVLAPATALGKCFVDGEWHADDHPKCVEAFGAPPEQSGDSGATAKPDSSDEPSSGPSVNAGYVACINWELFDQWSNAHTNDDGRAMSYLLENGCVRTESDWEISVLERAWSTTRIRVYTADGAVAMWTYREAVEE